MSDKKETRGRPKKDESQKLKTRFSISMNDEDYEIYKKSLMESGIKPSEYARTLLKLGMKIFIKS